MEVKNGICNHHKTSAISNWGKIKENLIDDLWRPWAVRSKDNFHSPRVFDKHDILPCSARKDNWFDMEKTSSFMWMRHNGEHIIFYEVVV